MRITGHSQAKKRATDKEKTAGVGTETKNSVP